MIQKRCIKSGRAKEVGQNALRGYRSAYPLPVRFLGIRYVFVIYILTSYSVFPISRRCAFVSFLSASRLCAIRRPSCILCIRVRACRIFILMKPDSINSSPVRADQQGIFDILKASPTSLLGIFYMCAMGS